MSCKPADAARAEAFRRLLGALLAGGATKDAVDRMRPLIDGARPEDLVDAVDSAVADGIGFDALKPAVSRLVNLLHGSLGKYRHAPPTGERLFSSLVAENAGLLAALQRGKGAAKAINDALGGDAPDIPGALRGVRALEAVCVELGAVEIHYRKKENILFPWFESRYPRYRCVHLMWEIQDDARIGLKELGEGLEHAGSLLEGGTPVDPAQLNRVLGRLYFDLNANVMREELALFPVMAPLVSASEGEALFAETKEYGFAFLGPAELARFLEPRATTDADGARDVAGPGAPAPAFGGGMPGFSGRTGSLPPEVLGALFAAVPVDMTWVDADDKVRWFSDSPLRIFPRSPAIVGRDVRNCHPHSSVDRVVAILDAFRTGAKDSESFWIEMDGRFISIEYFALRAPDGTYLGTLEVSQDLTEKRALSGQKRLASPS